MYYQEPLVLTLFCISMLFLVLKVFIFLSVTKDHSFNLNFSLMLDEIDIKKVTINFFWRKLLVLEGILVIVSHVMAKSWFFVITEFFCHMILQNSF